MRRFELVCPTAWRSASHAGRAGPDAKLVAGGTDLLPQLKNGILKTGCVVDLSGVAELDISRRAGRRAPDRRRGHRAEARAGRPRADAAIRRSRRAAPLVGSVQVRNLATLGGNLCNAAPSADMAPPLLALDAEAVIAGPEGRRRVPVASFFLGVRRTVLAPDELLVEIAVPHPDPTAAATTGGTRRGASSTSRSSASRRSSRCRTASARKARIALAAVAPVPAPRHRRRAGAGGPAGHARS